jgi:hypothetical protein
MFGLIYIEYVIIRDVMSIPASYQFTCWKDQY